MKPYLGLLILGIMLAGCDSEPSSTIAKGDIQPKPVTPVAKPAADAKASEGVNPDRAFQTKDLQTVKVTLDGKPYELWVMDTEAKREEGMMFLTDKEVRNDQGMVFVAPAPITDIKHGFWMHNTVLPLDIIYLAPDGKILNIQHGKPFDDTTLPPAATYQNVVELKAGQAAALGLKPGMKIDLPRDLKAAPE